jgi:uncharacterized protein YndB with AHSA1/START domain
MNEHRVDAWWAQTLTVDYEQARGLRPPGGNRDGTFNVNATRTVAVPVKRLYNAFVDVKLRERWLPGAPLRERTVLPGRSIRFDWEDGTSRVIVGFSTRHEGKSVVALSHERLPDAGSAAQKKSYWRERLAVLKELLEGTS